MKTIFKLVIGIACLAVLLSALLACHSAVGSDRTPPRAPGAATFDVDLTGYVANLNGATAVGISQLGQSTVEAAYQGGVVGYLSADYGAPMASNGSNYLVMRTEEYSPDAPETNSTGLVRVSFTKIVTENVTTEMTGAKTLRASGGKIELAATEGFRYTLKKDGSVLFAEVSDNGELDADSRKGFIAFDGLDTNAVYEVEYVGIGEEVTITQETIAGEIDKLYVMGDFTFISYVPIGESQRDYAENMACDKDGVRYWDKCDYYASAFRQNYVIHNPTGYVYSLDGYQINHLVGGLVRIGDLYYDLEVDAEGDLKMIPVVVNETILVKNVFKDKYGIKYVANEHLNVYDSATKTFYYTSGYYLLSEEGVVIHLETDWKSFDDTTLPNDFMLIEKIGEDFTKSPIGKDESYTLNWSPDYIYENPTSRATHIAQGYLYMYSFHPGAYSYFMRTNVETLESETKNYGICGATGGYWDYGCVKSLPLDYNTVLIWSDLSGTPQLYYGSVYGPDSCTASFDYEYDENGIEVSKSFSEKNMTVILENCTVSSEWYGSFDRKAVEEAYKELVFRCTEITSTSYYQLIRKEDGTPYAVNTDNYVAPKTETVVFHPLNK